MSIIATVFRRELAAYFWTPLAFIFIGIFLALAGALTFYLGGFFDRNQADLQTFFVFHPWLYLILVPAVGMRLWAEERKTGTIELLLTLPVTTTQVVLGKFLAAWAILSLALVLTFPMWITVNILGSPDNGVILASYVGSWLMAGAFLALASLLSALTSNQVIAFILSVSVSFLFLVSGLDMVTSALTGWAPALLIDLVTSFSFLTHFQQLTTGVIDLRTLVFFLSLITFALIANTIVIELKKAS